VSSLKYWIWLSSISGVGPVAASRLLEHFGTPEHIYNADNREYKEVEGIKPSDLTRLADKNIGAANSALTACAAIGCRVITLQDSEYPDRLRNIFDPPIVIYVQGSLPDVDDLPVIAVVGTRDCTPYGVGAAEGISYDLSLSGFVIATGLARGIDTAAARGALRAGGTVLGVIGSGHDIIYPRENKNLFEEVKCTGAIISEYPPGTPALRNHFPARNRIISGLSLGVAVIEAPKQSGALITAARALEQGRDVFTVPGNVGAISCEGSNALLREGAIPILSANDIISEYEELFPEKTEKKEIDNIIGVDYIDLEKIIIDMSEEEKTVAESIGAKTMNADEIITATGLSAQQALSALTMLEINGYVVRTNNGEYKLRGLA